MCEPYEAFLIGGMGSVFTVLADEVMWKLRIDDPVGVIPVHLVCAVWGLLSVGTFKLACAVWGLLSVGTFKLACAVWGLLSVGTFKLACAVWACYKRATFMPDSVCRHVVTVQVVHVNFLWCCC